MEPWQVGFIMLYGGLLAYLMLQHVQHSRTIASMSTMIETIIEKQNKMDDKLDRFIKQEIDILKELTRQNFETNKRGKGISH